ncbi:MFS general substrate transporter [Dothidotthia symphoricarpi CBS 119687]|uniref:MFS general substrate transporter n=1 Tax=Dothidotthia symphoricarpi CBS 119687 TaxID=1392245 RepID=A0A6A6AJF5_9PLEO|nr:MFS general substrate transporter [Dothidotthia symphoricarpi CBS 119687]KAF2131235.1 MFS general substrate transporter [Dothidotthia symphoricarpi CBS 119687]
MSASSTSISSHLNKLEKAEQTIEANPDVNRTPPDGGAKAWACVAGSFLLQFCSFGYVNACGIFQLYYKESLLNGQSSSALAWITTLQIFLLFMFGPAIGKLVDVFGCRKILPPFSILAIFSVCMLSLCTTYWQVVLAQGVCFGLAAAGLCIPAMAIATQWFSTKRGLAVGIVSAGSSLGGVIYPCVIPRLIEEVGFASAVRWTALLQGVLLLVANLLCSSPFPPVGKGDTKTDAASSSGFKAFKSWAWMFFVLGCFFTMWGLFAPLNYLPEMASLHGITDFAQYTLAIANAGSLVGRIVPGWASDRVGQFNTMCLVTFLSGILVIAFWLPLEFHPSKPGVVIFALLYGFVSGGFVSLGPPCVVSLADGRVDEIGLKLGGFCLGIALGALTGLPIEGAIKDKEGDTFTGLMCFSGASMILGGFCVLAARIQKGGSQLWKIV